MPSRGHTGFDAVWVPTCPSTASGMDVTAGKVSCPQSLWADSLFLPSRLGGKSVITQERRGDVAWHLGMQDVDSSRPLVAAGTRHPSPRL